MKELLKIELENEDVFMNPVFDEFCLAAILRTRGGGGDAVAEVEYKGFVLNANGMSIRVPTELFIDGKFVEAEGGKVTDSINPTDETVICKACFLIQLVILKYVHSMK